MSTFRFVSDERTGTSLKRCLERVDLFHSEVAKTRSDIAAMHAKSLAKLKECEALVDARRDALLAELDEIEMRRKVCIETAIVATEGVVSGGVVSDVDDVNLTALSCYKSSRCFYAIESAGEPDWKSIQDSLLQMFAFREFPVIGKVAGISVRGNVICVKIPDSNLLTWGSDKVRWDYLKHLVCVCCKSPNKFTYFVWTKTILNDPCICIKIECDDACITSGFTINIDGKTLDSPVFLTA